jgi:hypothetical protein
MVRRYVQMQNAIANVHRQSLRLPVCLIYVLSARINVSASKHEISMPVRISGTPKDNLYVIEWNFMHVMCFMLAIIWYLTCSLETTHCQLRINFASWTDLRDRSRKWSLATGAPDCKECTAMLISDGIFNNFIVVLPVPSGTPVSYSWETCEAKCQVGSNSVHLFFCWC